MIGRVSIVVFLFAMSVAAQNPICGSTSPIFINIFEKFSSPNYPQRYSSGLDCTWTFETSNDQILRLICDPFEIPCEGDSFIVTPSGFSDSRDAGTPVCGRKKLWDHSTGNTMTVNFNSKTSDEGGIFSCSVITRTRVPSNSALTTQLSIPSTTPQPICKCGNRPSLSLKIVGGQRASIVDWPWTVMIRDVIPFGVGEQFCGGTLISSSWVITAAHCTENRNANTMIAFIGQTNIDISTPSTQMITVRRIVQHPNYRRRTVNNDISLLQLQSPVDFEKSGYPICLPSRFVSYNFENEIGVATGWGTDKFGGESSSVLLKVSLSMLSTETCMKNINIGSKITNNMLCAYTPGKDTCSGDSGGPLNWEDNNTSQVYLVGIVSFGIGCAKDGYPGVYTKVTNYLNWIQQSTGDLCSS